MKNPALPTLLMVSWMVGCGPALPSPPSPSPSQHERPSVEAPDSVPSGLGTLVQDQITLPKALRWPERQITPFENTSYLSVESYRLSTDHPAIGDDLRPNRP